MADVVALGELLVDFVCKETDEIGYPTLVGKPGGAPGNYLAAVKKYGGSCAMIGKVGKDAFGRLLCQTLADAGIDLSGVIRAEDCFTTMAFVTLDETGNRHFSFARKPGADICLRSDEVNEALIRDCRVFHFGTLSMTDDPAREATRYAIRLAKAQGKVISLDPNLRKPLWPSEAAAKEAIEWSLHQADVVKISDEEIDFLWGISPEEGAQKLLREYGVSLVYATQGPKGCHAANKLGCVTVETPKGIHAVDTTGAGDIFGGSAMSQLLKNGKHPGELIAEELKDIVRFACCAASLSTQKQGGISSVPEEAEVRALVNTMA